MLQPISQGTARMPLFLLPHDTDCYMCHPSPLKRIISIGVQLLYSVGLGSSLQQSQSALHIYM